MVIYIVKKIFTFLLILFLLAQLSFCVAYFSSDAHWTTNMGIFDAYLVFFRPLFSDSPILLMQNGVSIYSSFSQIFLLSFELCLFAVICSIVIGIPFGVILGLCSSESLNNAIQLICLAIYACPIVWIAVLVMYLSVSDWSFFVNIKSSIDLSWCSLTEILFSSQPNKLSLFINELHAMMIPIIILAVQPCIVTIQIVSKQVEHVLHQPYIKSAAIREKSFYKVLCRNLLPNALPSAISQLTYNVTTLLFLTMVIEIMFHRAGVGTWIMIAFYQHNFYAIAVAILVCGIIISSIMLLLELIATTIYPMRHRERYE